MREVVRGDKHNLKKNLQIAKHVSVKRAEQMTLLSALQFADSQVVFVT